MEDIKFKVDEYEFNQNTVKELEKNQYGNNWPVVYIINNEKNAYVGETLSATSRTSQHLENPKRQILNLINIISSGEFNKSVILDLESFLIKYMSADEKFVLQNGNAGLQNYNYFQKERYEENFPKIWEELRKKGLVEHTLDEIENTNLFKFSPYKTLTQDQHNIVVKILKQLLEDVSNEKESNFIVHGGAGTGKTILGIYLVKLLTEMQNLNMIDELDDNENEFIEISKKIFEKIKDFKIGIVIPMVNFKGTLKKVFKSIEGLNKNMVISPYDLGKEKIIGKDEKFDILIVDEAHRLKQYKNLAKFDIHKNTCKALGLEKEATELDWILAKSKYSILLYDENQSIKKSDVDREKFVELQNEENTHIYQLKTQLRCLAGGDEYINYINNIFSKKDNIEKIDFAEYDFKMFNDVNDMINNIKEKDKQMGLCRNVAGYAWKNNKKDVKDYDIEIDGYKYKWNTGTEDWVNSKNAINEIGCIHTVQGFDLNYTGVIIGNELKYDKENHKIYADRKEYKDSWGKANTSDEELLIYIFNIYKVLFTRGMRGTYVYVCDENLREYLSKFIEGYNEDKNIKVVEE